VTTTLDFNLKKSVSVRRARWSTLRTCAVYEYNMKTRGDQTGFLLNRGRRALNRLRWRAITKPTYILWVLWKSYGNERIVHYHTFCISLSSFCFLTLESASYLACCFKMDQAYIFIIWNSNLVWTACVLLPQVSVELPFSVTALPFS
jgi:hypothetical protein